MDHFLSDDRHSLVAGAVVTSADGHTEREAAKAMINDARQALDAPDISLTLGADKGYDAQEFFKSLQEINVAPGVARHTLGRNSAVPEAVAESAGYGVSQQKRKLIMQGFGWDKTVGGIARLVVRGLKKVDQVFVLAMAGNNLTRMRLLGQIRVQ